MKPYPEKACFTCLNKVGKCDDEALTVSFGRCDVCGETTGVVCPGDWGWPDFPGHEKRKRDPEVQWLMDMFNMK